MSTRATTTRIAVAGCAGLVALFLGVVGVETCEEGPRVRSRDVSPTRVEPPTLVQAPKDAVRGGDLPEATPEHAPAPAPAPRSMDDLIADLRREVEPGFWEHTPGARLEGRNGVLIVRATPDVLDAVGARLDELRATGAVDPEQAPVDHAVVEELRAVMRGMLDRHLRLDSAARMLRSDPNAALQLVAEVERVEPDNDSAKALRLLATNSGDGFAGLGAVPPRSGPHADWLLRWPSAATWARLNELRTKAGKAGDVRFGLELDELLKRGALTIRLDGVPLWVAIRRLQIEALVEIALAPDVGLELEAQTVSLHAVGRSLEFVLDALLAQVPAGHRWVATRRSIAIVRDGDTVEAAVRLRYFDVGDVLGMPSAAPGPREPGEAPMPPAYTEPGGNR